MYGIDNSASGGVAAEKIKSTWISIKPILPKHPMKCHQHSDDLSVSSPAGSIRVVGRTGVRWRALLYLVKRQRFGCRIRMPSLWYHELDDILTSSGTIYFKLGSIVHDIARLCSRGAACSLQPNVRCLHKLVVISWSRRRFLHPRIASGVRRGTARYTWSKRVLLPGSSL